MGLRVNEVLVRDEVPVDAGGLIGYGADDESPDTGLPAPPTQARGVDKRDRIYRAAIDRYASDGVAATKVEDVIADAGVSWATFFRYFPRKQDVLIELAARHYRRHVKGIAEGGAGDGRLRTRTVGQRTLEALLEAGETSAELHSAALLEVFAHPARFAALVGEGHPQPVVGLVTNLLEQARDRGELRAGLDPAAAALTVVAGALFPAVQAAAIGADPGPPMRGALDILWRGLTPE
jgi:AcrR family transcriptional regulator